MVWNSHFYQMINTERVAAEPDSALSVHDLEGKSGQKTQENCENSL
jgi:hypothetical protein